MTTPSRHPRSPVANLEEAMAVLRRDGGRVSAARRALLEALFGADGPVSAERLATHAALDVASTYRSLDQLEHLGLARHVHLGHGPGLYEVVTEGEREYLVCERCGSVRAVAPERLDAVRDAIERASGYRARFGHFPIVGLCASCAKAEGEPTGRPGLAAPAAPPAEDTATSGVGGEDDNGAAGSNLRPLAFQAFSDRYKSRRDLGQSSLGSWPSPPGEVVVKNSRRMLVVLVGPVIAAVLAFGSVALGAGNMPKPKAGTWRFDGVKGDHAGGFKLVRGTGAKRGNLYLTGVHTHTLNYVGCPDQAQSITVAGRFRLKPVTQQKGYPPVWAVGKHGTERRYSDGRTGLVSIPAKVTVNGRPAKGGAIKVYFDNATSPTFGALIIEFEGLGQVCITPWQNASHH